MQYASWNGLPVDDFFGSPQAREDFKAHISFMVNRTNTVNGRRYRSEVDRRSCWVLANKSPTSIEHLRKNQGAAGRHDEGCALRRAGGQQQVWWVGFVALPAWTPVQIQAFPT